MPVLSMSAFGGKRTSLICCGRKKDDSVASRAGAAIGSATTEPERGNPSAGQTFKLTEGHSMECLMSQPSLIGQGWWSIGTERYLMPRTRSPQPLRTTDRVPNWRRRLIIEDERYASRADPGTPFTPRSG
jgi:hypothetical protein